MANTHTTSFNFVNNGDSTVENPGNLVGEQNINVMNAEIQWEGSKTSGTGYSHSSNINSGSATATEETTTTTETNQEEKADTTQSGSSVNTSADANTPSGTGTAVGYSVTLEAKIIDDQTSTQNGDIFYDTNSGSPSTTITADGSWKTVYSVSGSGTAPDSSYGIAGSHTPSASLAEIDVRATVSVDYETTSVNSDTTSVSYPSVPSGYSFDNHYWREESNGSYVDSDYVYSNKVGQSRSVTSNDPNDTRTLEMKTKGQDSYTYTNYTKDASVGGSVSASTNETLSDNETSNWISLSGFSTGDNTFNHDINDSGEGYYRIRFTWEFALPTAVKIEDISINGTTYSVTLADPNDSALDYSVYRVQVDGSGVLAYDVVEPSDPDALNYYIYHPIHGKLALREKK